MREPIRFLGENSTLPVSCIPNAGLPLNVDGQAVYPLEPEPFANDLYEFVTKHNISVVGGCCGTTPAHLKLLVDKLNQTPAPNRPPQSTPQLASAMSAIAMRQDPAPTLLGERLNAQGSRKFKRLLLEEDYDSILEIAREQVEYGAHALDISCAVTERPDEAELMRKVVKKLEMGVDVPLVIDTTELDVLEIALKTAPGRCLINSTHLEAGRAKATYSPMDLAAFTADLSSVFRAATEREAMMQMMLRETNDFKEGVKAGFDRREPVFTGT